MNCPQCEAPLPDTGAMRGLCTACLYFANLTPAGPDEAEDLPVRNARPTLSEIQQDFP